MSNQGETYARFIEAELKAEHERRTSLDARALAISTTSSGLLALVLALVALVTGKDRTFTDWGARGVVLALALFVVASSFGLLASAARRFDVARQRTLVKMVDQQWEDSEPSARNITAYLNATTIKSLRSGNNFKAALVLWAIWLQFGAFVSLVGSVAYELRDLVF